MVTHDIKNHKFKIESPKGLSCLEYDLTGHVFTVLHTIVPAALSGKGLAAQLAKPPIAGLSKIGIQFVLTALT